MILALCLAVVALVFLLWMLFACAIYALPLGVGVMAALLAYEAGAGWLVSALVAMLIGALALSVGRLLLSAGSFSIRVVTTALFSVPAGVAGCHAIFGITAIGTMAEGWRIGLSSIAALVVACAAAARLVTPVPAGSVQSGPVIAPATNRGGPIGAGLPVCLAACPSGRFRTFNA